METTKRYIYKTLTEFAADKFVLLTGPRQVGKTTLAKTWLEGHGGRYLNWDIAEDRTTLLGKPFHTSQLQSHLVLDEIHKYARWKSWLKGLYDAKHDRIQVVVTGSARLDTFQKGGDSLLGRYELLHLHPFSIGEILHGEMRKPPGDWLDVGSSDKTSQEAWKQLYLFGGFPEPFSKQSELHHTRWTSRRRELLVKEDLREISQIRNLSLVEHLAILIPTKIMSPLSVNSLREELQVSHDTVSSWIEMLERLYFCYRISPYNKKISRSIQKEQKIYLWDWSTVEDVAARFENMVGSCLLKSIHAWNDVGYGQFELQYLRDKEKREVDFVIVNKRKPICLIECKLNDKTLSPNLFHFANQLDAKIPKIQLVNSKNIDVRSGTSRVVSADKFLSALC